MMNATEEDAEFQREPEKGASKNAYSSLTDSTVNPFKLKFTSNIHRVILTVILIVVLGFNVSNSFSSDDQNEVASPEYEYTDNYYSLDQEYHGSSPEDNENNVSSPVQVFDELASQGNESTKPRSRAVIYMGVQKTGSSTLEHLEGLFMQELNQDGYFMPFEEAEKIWDAEFKERMRGGMVGQQLNFATCFLPPDNASRKSFPCVFELLHAGLEIAVDGRNMLVSSENFAHADYDGLKALSSYLKAFDEVILSIFYRRYFEWMVSMENERRKKITLTGPASKWDNNIVEQVEKAYKDKEPDHSYTSSVVARAEEHFEPSSIEVTNMHDGVDNSEEFYCEVIPDAERTCEKMMSQNEGIKNAHVELIYRDLGYYANKHGLVNINTDEELDLLASAAQEYQEVTLKLTKDDFPMTYPSSEAMDWLLNKSLEIEQKLFPDFFKSDEGEESLRATFEVKSKSGLCILDVDTLFNEPVWISFFTRYSS